MAFSHRMAALAAVVLIPVGIAGTSYLLSDDPDPPTVPSDVELGEPTTPPAPPPTEEPREEVVPRPSATEGSLDDDDAYDPGLDDDGDGDLDDDGDDGPDDD
ncbi:hypothetical protein [Streptomyces sp. SBT349]|uniref:hypothetical protein n=1 Tax=Streptomyces sp. SBT349 TaxID=1580539 RepID=UPI00066A4454|nr:hypothetical protein [Streptomyces sp. SBT349]